MEQDGASPNATLASLVAAIRVVHARGDISTVVYYQLIALKPLVPEGEEEPQPETEILENPARVLRTQERHITLLPNSRYVPVAPGRRAGIIVLKDCNPDEAEDLLQVCWALLALRTICTECVIRAHFYWSLT